MGFPSLTVPSLSYPLLHGNLIVVTDGVLAQEVKLHHVLLVIHLGVQLDVLHSQRAAAHCVRSLTFLLFVTCPQRKLHGKHSTVVFFISNFFVRIYSIMTRVYQYFSRWDKGSSCGL